jgi:cytoskeletal protein CcmA (bactofilin family)
MKRLLISALFFALVLAFYLPPAFAQTNVASGENITLAKTETVNEDYFAWGERVIVSGIVNGDAYVGGGNVIIEGEINGDLIAAGGSTNIMGKVSNDVRIAGGQVNVSGEIGGNITLLGGSLEISDSAKINGGLTAAGGNLTVFAPLGRGATFATGNTTLANQINGNVTGAVGNLTLTSNANIRGNLVYLSDSKAQIQDGATVSGSTVQKIPPQKEQDTEKAAKYFASANVMLKFILFLSALLVAFIIVKLAPRYSFAIADVVEKRPFASLAMGLATLILFPIAVVITLVTVVGIPLALISLVMFFILLYVSKIFVSLAVGRKLAAKSGIILQVTIGLALYYFLTLIPVIGWIVCLITLLVGLGAIVLAKNSLYKTLKDKKVL